jgi:hypothetical protein
VGKQERGGERSLGVLPRRAQDGPPGTRRIVVDCSDPVLLPGLQRKGFPDVLALRDEQASLDELDDISSGGTIVFRHPL